MTFTPESLKRQNELIRDLQKQLAATEQELANQKWILEQYLQSPSWRLTAPVRWAARQLRALREAVSRLLGNPPGPAAAAHAEPAPAGEEISPADARLSADLKKVFTSFCRSTLESFLASEATLTLPAASSPDVSILLVLFNRAELSLACLRAIAEVQSERIEVIIVDNASSDETPLLLNRLRGARVIRNAENRHFLLGVNQAAALAGGKYLLLLNNDAQLLPGAIRAAINAIETSSDIGAVGGKILLLDGSLQEAGSIVWNDGSCLGYGRGDTPFASQYMFRRDVDYCSGAFLLTPRAVWTSLVGFDEAFRPAYYEETDYCMRLWQRGYRVVYEPTAVLLHYEFASSESVASATELQASHQKIFAARHRAALDRRERPDVNRAVYGRMRHTGKRVLFLDDRPPHVGLGSGFPRANAFVRALLKHGCFVTIYPLNGGDEEWSAVYSDIPREVEVMMGAGQSMLELFMQGRKDYYDFLIVSRPHNMEMVLPVMKSHPDWFERVRVIYDAEAVFAHRTAGLRALSGDPMSAEEFERTIGTEIDLASNADHIVAVSHRDCAEFRMRGIHSVSVVGHALAPAPPDTPFETREGFLFVGAVHEETSPNSDSLIWFLSEVFPRIQAKLGGAPLAIAGINQSARVRELAGPNVHILGRVDDLTALYANARVFIAPTRYAAGIPHKIHEAAARGLPVVTTSLLSCQLGWTDEELGVADAPEEFADRCVELYGDFEKWSKLRAAALQRVATECSQEQFEKRIYDILDEENIERQSGASRFANVGMDG